MKEQELLFDLVEIFTCLPGVGARNAQRFVYSLLGKNRDNAKELVKLLGDACESVKECARCRMYTDRFECSICSDKARDKTQICVVENPTDLLTLEQNTEFKGVYFVMHGKISPLDGMGPDEIKLPLLAQQARENEIKELILAISTTVEGDVTAQVLKRMV